MKSALSLFMASSLLPKVDNCDIQALKVDINGNNHSTIVAMVSILGGT